MKRCMRTAGLALIVAATVLVTPSGSAWQPAAEKAVPSDPAVLAFSGIPSKGSVTLLETWQPLLKMLEKEAHLEIRVLSATNYEAVIDGLKNNKIDIAALGPFSYIIAKDEGAQITVVAAQVQEKDEPTYRSYGFTRAGSQIRAIEDFRGKKVCFVNDESTSGYLYPVDGLLAVGIDPEKDIQRVFTGYHDASVLAVADRKCDAGFAFDMMVERQAIDQGKIHPGQIVTVWKSEPIPEGPLVVSDHLPPELRQRLISTIQKKANADYQRAEGFCQGECAVSDGDAYGYKEVEDKFYDGVRRVCERIRYEVCKG